MDLPFNGAITHFLENESPKEVREAIKNAKDADK